MEEKKRPEQLLELRMDPEELLELRIDPEERLCPAFDSVCIAKFRAASEKMGVRVLDNCCEDHIM